jgi:hypothetical protein
MIVLVDRTGTHMNRLVFGNSEVNVEMTYDGGINLKIWPEITQYRFRKRGGLERTNVNNSIHDDHAYGTVVGRTRGCMLHREAQRQKIQCRPT